MNEGMDMTWEKLGEKVADDFFAAGAVELSKKLLGTILVRKLGDQYLAGRIVETEAYLQEEPSCHAHRGLTERSAPMFEAAGTSYVYVIYGMHHCYNIVSGEKGDGEAVLIRALEPVMGLEKMFELRGVKKERDLCSGPAKLCRALQITKEQNFLPLQKKEITDFY